MYPANKVRSLLKGFTLVELLLVISIIGILAGVVIGVISPKRQKEIATDTVTQTTMYKFAEGIEAYYSANNTLPTAQMFTDDTITFINAGAKPPSLKYKVNGDVFYLCDDSAGDANIHFVYDSSISSGIFKCGPGQAVVSCTPYGC